MRLLRRAGAEFNIVNKEGLRPLMGCSGVELNLGDREGG